MHEPYAHWGHVPVYVAALDIEFMREFVVASYDTPPTVGEDGIAHFTPIKLITSETWSGMSLWQKKQAQVAVDDVIAKFPTGLGLVPAQGFYVSVWRRRSVRIFSGENANDSYEMETLMVSGISIHENVDGVDRGRRGEYPREVINLSEFKKVVHLGEDYNPYPSLFSKVVAELPEAWSRWIVWRRRKRWKPVPEWLVKLRAETRERKHSPAA